MWAPILVLAVVGLAFWGYNALVRLRVQAQSAWSDIDVQLKRRYDLIPNLVETVKGYAGHERQTLEAVVQARARAQGAVSPGERAEAEGLLDQIGRLFSYTRQLDAVLNDAQAVERYARSFLEGNYEFIEAGRSSTE